MARFHGEVGYGVAASQPNSNGVWQDEYIEIEYFGDVIRNTRRLDDGQGLNDDIVLDNSISIIADQHAIENFMYIKYVRWMGGLWAVKTVEVRSPRLILYLGGVYNGPTV